MTRTGRTYHSIQFTLVVALVTSMLLPLAQHLCVDMGHSMVASASAAAAPSEACPSHAENLPDDADAASGAADMVECCALVATNPAERAALISPDLQTTQVVLSAAVLADWQRPVRTEQPAPEFSDSGPPPAALRPHLTFSVLLI